jgi:hypothetical protein
LLFTSFFIADRADAEDPFFRVPLEIMQSSFH